MKKIILALFLAVSGLFALTTDQKFDLILNKLNNIDTKVNNIDKRVDKLEEKVNKTEKTQKDILNKQLSISKNVEKSQIISCGKIKILDFNYAPIKIGLDDGYKFNFTIQNNYSKTIKHLNMMIGFVDNEDNTLVQEHLIKDTTIEPTKTKKITDTYVINDDMATYLATTPKKDIHLDIKPLYIKFSDGSRVKCSRW